MNSVQDSIYYEQIVEKHRYNKDKINAALDIVKNWIIKKQRVLYGGMAIDFSLKCKNHPGIYSDDVIPDYDFYSPDFFTDSLELADILHNAGIDGVSSINAMHFGTRRVRVDFITVADISYLPKQVYKKIKTLSYNKFKFIHPDMLFMYLHRSMCYLYEMAPQEVFTSRTHKDIPRINMLYEFYKPMQSEKPPSWITAANKQQLVTKQTPINNIKPDILTDFWVWVIIQHLVGRTGYQAGVKNNQLFIKFPKALADLEQLAVVSTDPVRVRTWNTQLADSTKPAVRAKLLDDFIMETACLDNKQVKNATGQLLSSSSFQGIKTTTCQAVFLYLLAENFNTGDCRYKWMYNDLLHSIKLAERDVSKFKNTPVFMQAEYTGEQNLNTSVFIQMQRAHAKINSQPVENIRPPHGYYPANNTPHPEFEFENIWLYYLNQEPMQQFTVTEFPK